MLALTSCTGKMTSLVPELHPKHQITFVLGTHKAIL